MSDPAKDTPVQDEGWEDQIEAGVDIREMSDDELYDLMSDFEESYGFDPELFDSNRWKKVVAGTSLGVIAFSSLATVFTDVKSPWYKSLKKPSFQPPNWAFPVVWTALYTDILVTSGLSIRKIYKSRLPHQARKDAKKFITALSANMAANAAWPLTFFRMKKPKLATVSAAVLAASSTDLVRRVGEVDTKLGVALSPYAAWSSFATALMVEVVRLNPDK